MKRPAILVVCLFTALYFSCSESTTIIAGTETGNGSGGVVAFANGTPAAGAHVTMVPSFYEEQNPPNRDFMIVSANADSNGTYRFRNLIEGYYNIFCEKDGYKSLIDSVYITDTLTTVRSAILKAPGSLSGVSRYSAGNFPVGAYLVLTGSRYAARCNEKNGSFSLSGVPSGMYKAKITGSTVDYFQNSFNITVHEGVSDSLEKPLVLVSNYITALLPVNDGSVWVGTTNGLLHLSENEWHTYGLLDGLSSSRITCLAQGADTSLWIGTTFRLAHFVNGLVTANFDFIGAIKAVNVKMAASAPGGEVWFGTGDGIFVHQNGRWDILPFADRENEHQIGSIGSTRPYAISDIAFHNGNAFVGTHHGMYRCDSGSIWRTVKALDNLSVNAVEVIDDTTFFAATGNGLYRCTADSAKKIDIAASGRADEVTCIVLFDNRLFAGTGNGLYMCENGVWTAADMPPLNGTITALEKDGRGTVWIGTANGLCTYTKGTFEIIR